MSDRAMNPITLRTALPSDAAWITARHATLYAQADGFDGSFAPLVADILSSFFAAHDPLRETGWIASRGKERLGCIFCVAAPDGAAKLRLFLVEPASRGTGLAQTMLETCITFARNAGYPHMRLWTHESHRAACRLYARNGFALTDSHPVRSFGQDLIEQTWERAL